MADLYFKHSDGRLSLVRKDVKPDTVYRMIEDYATRISNDRFVIHYVRSHSEEVRIGATSHFITYYDVGSWSEFFYYTDLESKDLKKHLGLK